MHGVRCSVIRSGCIDTPMYARDVRRRPGREHPAQRASLKQSSSIALIFNASSAHP
jgi:hypothetical protein